jgi:hypothetical protein
MEMEKPTEEEMQSPEGLIKSMPKKQRIGHEDHNGMKDMEKGKERGLHVFGPKKPDVPTLKKWAWETGSADEFQGEEQYEAWERHVKNETVNFTRRKDILEQVGLEPEMYELVGHLLQYHLWPETREMDMLPMEILGTEKEARLLQEYQSMMELSWKLKTPGC